MWQSALQHLVDQPVEKNCASGLKLHIFSLPLELVLKGKIVFSKSAAKGGQIEKNWQSSWKCLKVELGLCCVIKLGKKKRKEINEIASFIYIWFPGLVIQQV